MAVKQTTVTHMKRIAADPHEHVIFRQTRNWKLKRWNCVQRQGTDGSWTKITNEELVLNDKGWAFALWRLRNIMVNLTDNIGRYHWKAKMYKIRHGIYMTYYLVCTKNVHSIQGTY